MEKTVLCYLEKDHQFLMLLRNKKKEDINTKKWIGVGGHVEKGESIEQALIREVKEETGLSLKSYSYRGELLFINDDFKEIMYLFTSNDFTGELIECNEGELHWVDIDKVLDLNLWEGDRAFLLPLIQTQEFIKMTLRYSNNRFIEAIKEDN